MIDEAPSGDVSRERPWPGLAPFTEEAHDFFHGRDREVEQLARLVRRALLTILYGQSGLGKSSLLRAGLFPRLRDDHYLPVGIRLDFSPEAPDLLQQVLEAIAAEARRHGVEAPSAQGVTSLWEFFHRKDADFWSARNALLAPLIVFDQFEEILTLGRRDPAVRERSERFLAQLADLVEGRTPADVERRIEEDTAAIVLYDFGPRLVKVILSFREDYLPEMDELARSVRSILQNRMRLAPMDGAQALEAVIASGGTLLDETVARRIILFVAGPRTGEGVDFANLVIEPALLCLVCRELNEKRIALGRAAITADLIEREAQQGIIAEFYRRSLADIDPRVRVFVEDQLLTEAGYRDSYALDDALALPGVSRTAIEALVDRRLLRLEERFGVLRIELTHDLLTGVAKESRDRRKENEREAARRRRTRRVAGIAAVAAGVALALAAVFAVLLDRALGDKQHAIEAQSSVLLAQAVAGLEQNVAREPYALLAEALRLNPGNQGAAGRSITLLSQRRFPIAIATHTVGRVEIGDTAGWLASGDPYAIVEGRMKRFKADGTLSEDRPLDEREKALRSGDARKSATMAGKTAIARDNVVTLSENGAALGKPLEHGGTVNALSFSADGRLLATASSDQLVRVWDTATQGLAVPPFRHEGAVLSVEMSPDGRTVTSASLDGTARLWSVAEGRPMGEPLNHDAPILSASTSPDGRRVVTLSIKGALITWDVTRLREDRDAPEMASRITALAFDDEGTRLAAGMEDGSIMLMQASGRLGTRGAFVPRLTWRPEQEASPVTALRFRGADRLLAGNATGEARWIDAQKGTALGKPMPAGAAIRAFETTPDGTRAVFLGDSRSAQVWQLEAQVRRTLPFEHARIVRSVRLSPDGSLAVTIGDDRTVRLWDTATGAEWDVWRTGSRPVLADFSRDGRSIVTVVGSEIGFWSLGDGRRGYREVFRDRGDSELAREEPRFVATPAIVWSAQMNAERTQLLTAGIGGTAQVWDLRGGARASGAFREGGSIASALFSRDGRWLVTLTDDRAIHVRDSRSGQAVADVQRAGQGADAMALSPRGDFLAIGAGKRLRILPLALGLTGAPPAWLPALLERAGGARVDASGVVVSATEGPAALPALSSAGNDEWSAWGRWVLEDRLSRSTTQQ